MKGEKNMRKFLMTTTLIAAASTAHAVTLNFGALPIGGSGPCLSDCVVGTGGLRSVLDGVKVEGYNAGDHAGFLTQKPLSDGFSESGLGESDGATSSDPNHEIAIGRFVVIDNALAETLGFEPKSLTIGSLQAGERGAIFGYSGPDGAADLIPGDLTLLHVFTGGNTGTFDVSALSFDKYVVGALPGFEGVTSNTLVSSEVLTGVPEPSTWVMGVIGFGILGLLAGNARRNRPQRAA